MRQTAINATRITEPAALRGDDPRAGEAAPGQPLAPALEAAARDMYLALRTLAATPPGTAQPDTAGPVVRGKIRQAADATGAAWQCLAGGHSVVSAAAMPGPGRAVLAAARRVAAASSQPAATAPSRDEVAAMAMVTLHSLAAAAGYFAWEASGLRASRFRNAQDFLEAAAEQLREAAGCAQAASRAHRAAPACRDGEPGAGYEQAATGLAPRVPCPPAPRRASRRDMRQAIPRRKRLHYRIRELLARRTWLRKRSG